MWGAEGNPFRTSTPPVAEIAEKFTPHTLVVKVVAGRGPFHGDRREMGGRRRAHRGGGGRRTGTYYVF